MHTQALEGVTPVVTAAEVAAWLGIEEDDALIPMLSKSATSTAIDYLGMELISRSRRLTYRTWPTTGTDTSPSLSCRNDCLKREIELPYSHTATTITTALFFNGAETPHTLSGKPFTFYIDTIPPFDEGQLAVLVEYETGYASIDDVPEQIKMAVLSMVAFMYEHRGTCDANEAMAKSGALDLLLTYKTDLVVF